MKKITLLLLLMILPNFMVGQNLISDSGFANTADVTIGPWLGYGYGFTTDGITGSRVARVNIPEGTIRQDFPVVVGQTYQVTFDYLHNSTVGTLEPNMIVRFRDAAVSGTAGNLTLGNATTGYTLSTSTDVWLKGVFTITIPPGVANGRLQFFKGINRKEFRLDNVSVRRLYTFNGNTDSDFSTATNWDLGEMPTDDDIIIPSGKNLVINGGATLGNITNNGTLTVNPGGSLVVDPIANVSGVFNYNRTLQANKWHLVSSPVVGATYNDTWIANNGIASGTGNNRGISTYQNGAANPTTGQWTYAQAGSSGTFETSKGYSLRRSSTGTVSFTGTYPSGARPFSATVGAGTSFNLLGNPYPMYLSVSKFFAPLGAALDNTTANGKLTEDTIWLWDQASNAYIHKTSGLDGSFQIAPGQAFFISASNPSSIIFYQFNGSHQSDTFLKSSKTQVILKMDSNNVSASTELFYLPQGTNDFDNGYDASLFTGVNASFNLYTSQLSEGSKKLARQVVSDSNLENTIIPIGIKAAAGQEISFSAEAMNLPEGIKVFLEDREKNTLTRLDETNSNYKVTLTEAIDGNGRFFLHTKTNSTLNTGDVTLENVSIYKTPNATLRVVGLENGITSNIKIYNVIGKLVMDSNFQSKGAVDILLPKLAMGVYIVKLQNDNGSINKKIILE